MLNVVSFNVRYPCKDDGLNYFPYRLPRIVKRIRKELPDIIGFQELTEESYLAMSSMLPEYVFVGHSREVDFGGESTRIAYLKDRFILMTFDCGWLSPTPYLPASRYPGQSECPRVFTTVRLFDKTNRKNYLVTNVHLDYLGYEPQILGLKQVYAHQTALKTPQDDLCIVAGDFNIYCQDPLCEKFAEYGYHDLATSVSYTDHEFGNARRGRIDYILTDREVKSSISTWNVDEDGGRYSDHEAFVAAIEV